MKYANCHPERAHTAKGLCKSCYARRYGRTRVRTYEQRAHERDTWLAHRRTIPGRLMVLLSSARSVAKRKGYEFNLDLSDIVIPTHCPVLGIPLDPAAPQHSDSLPSLDRFDSTKGYVKGNVWVISWRANRIKQDASFTEIEALHNAMKMQQPKNFRALSNAWFKRKAA